MICRRVRNSKKEISAGSASAATLFTIDGDFLWHEQALQGQLLIDVKTGGRHWMRHQVTTAIYDLVVLLYLERLCLAELDIRV